MFYFFVKFGNLQSPESLDLKVQKREKVKIANSQNLWRRKIGSVIGNCSEQLQMLLVILSTHFFDSDGLIVPDLKKSSQNAGAP